MIQLLNVNMVQSMGSLHRSGPWFVLPESASADGCLETMNMFFLCSLSSGHSKLKILGKERFGGKR